MHPRHILRRDLAVGRALYGPDDHPRPGTRGECESGERPCPYVACRHHLYLDPNPETGSVKSNFPDLEVDEMAESCSLDVASTGGGRPGVTLERTGELLNVVRESVRKIERKAVDKVAAALGLTRSEALRALRLAAADPVTLRLTLDLPPEPPRRRLPVVGGVAS